MEKTEIKISVGEYEDFIQKGMTIVEPGWTKFEAPSSKDKILPNLSIGDKVNTLFKLKEKETTPPKHYTIETLNNYLMNPFKEDKKELDDKLEEMLANGEEIDGAVSTGTTLTFTALIQVNPNCCAVTNNLPARIQVINDGAAALTLTNVALTIIKVG